MEPSGHAVSHSQSPTCLQYGMWRLVTRQYSLVYWKFSQWDLSRQSHLTCLHGIRLLWILTAHWMFKIQCLSRFNVPYIEVKQGWGDGSKEDNRAGQPSQQATSNTATVKEMSHRIHGENRILSPACKTTTQYQVCMTLNWDVGFLTHAELKAAIREFETDFVTKHGHKVHALLTKVNLPKAAN